MSVAAGMSVLVLPVALVLPSVLALAQLVPVSAVVMVKSLAQARASAQTPAQMVVRILAGEQVLPEQVWVPASVPALAYSQGPDQSMSLRVGWIGDPALKLSLVEAVVSAGAWVRAPWATLTP